MSEYLPDISVIVCAYNHGKWLERCIRSLNHQVNIERSAYEVIVVDDASTDYTQLILDKFKKFPNIRMLKNEKNIGLSGSINKAIRESSGRYIVRVDSDDYVARMCLYIMKLFLDMNKNYQAVAADYIEIDQFENFIRKVNCFEEEIACGVMFRKECLFDIGLYDESFKMREGHDLKRRFLEKFVMGRLEFPLYKYRKHPENRTNDKKELDMYDKKLHNTGE